MLHGNRSAILDYVPAESLNQVFRFPKIIPDGQLILSLCGTKEQKQNSCVVQLIRKAENMNCFFKAYMFVEVPHIMPRSLTLP